MNCTLPIRLLPILLWLLASLASAAGPAPMAPEQGVFLVADETIADPRFRETVILLVYQGEESVAGLIVNKPLPAGHEERIPDLPKGLDHVFFGGPVTPLHPYALLQGGNKPGGSMTVMNDLFFTDWQRLQGSTPETRHRLYLGYAGWTPGQLQREIARGDWHLVPGDAASIFAPDPEQIWQRLRTVATGVWI